MGGQDSLCEKRGMWVPGPSPEIHCSPQELQLREAQNENARLVEENSRLSGRASEKEQVPLLLCQVLAQGAYCWGIVLLGEGAGGAKCTHPTPFQCPLARLSGRMWS